MFAWPRFRWRLVLPRISRAGIGVLAACCLLVAGGGVAHGQSCGHYVKRLGPGFVPGKAAAEKVAAQSHDEATKPPCGCRGPECHRAPLEHLPVAPATPERITAPQDATMIAAANVRLEMEGNWLFGDAAGRPSRGYPLETNRPPSS